MIRLLKQSDYQTWINTAREVEPLFGPMADSEEFCKSINICIENNNAYGIMAEDACIAGIIAIDRDLNEILWLAVKKEYRGNRFGELLIQKAIEQLHPKGDIFVQTFASDVKEGKSARILYERNGFVELKNAGKNPAGIETVIMIKRK